MAITDVPTAARLLIMRHGLQARVYADCQALEAFLCSDVEASERWERVSKMVEAMLAGRLSSSAVAA